MPKRDDPAGHRVADFVNSGADWRFNMFAAVRVRKSLPTAPGLHHENSFNISLKRAHQERDN
jgi:hypothetical protein